MKRTVILWAATVGVGLLLALGAGTAQQKVLHGSVADIYATDVEVDLATGVATLTGNVRVQIKGAYDATMTAPTIVAKQSQEKNQVISLDAQGPVNLDVLTKGADGKQFRVTARCSDSATFSEQTMVAVLKGNAHAEVTGLPRAEAVESARYDGDTLTVDFKHNKIKLTQAHVNVEMAPEAEKSPAGTKQ